jgi:hypothetical protein
MWLPSKQAADMIFARIRIVGVRARATVDCHDFVLCLFVATDLTAMVHCVIL